MIDIRHPVTGTADIDRTIDWENGDEPKVKGWQPHTVVHMNGDNEETLPVQFQLLNAGWGHENFQLPYMVFMPEKQRLALIAEWGFEPGQTAITFSDDFGAIWSEPQHLQDGNGQALKLQRGVGLTYLGAGQLSFGIEYTADGQPTRWFSDDYGQTWTRSAPIPLSVTGTPMYYWDPMLIDRDEQGNIVRVLEARWQPSELEAPGDTGTYSRAMFWQSEDLGLTWSPEKKVPQWESVNEISFARARNGDIVAACRTDKTERFIEELDFFCGLAISISKDDGATWTELDRLYEFGRHHPSLNVLPNGDILMTYAVRAGYENTSDGLAQYGIEALVSQDNGATWNLDRRYVLASWRGKFTGEFEWLNFAQSTSTTLLPDGSILTAFGAGLRNPGPEYKFMMDTGLVKWRLD